MKKSDMSPKAVFKRLRLASELRDLCMELGKYKKAKKPTEDRGNSKVNELGTSGATYPKNTA
jgi:hypothetical protein